MSMKAKAILYTIVILACAAVFLALDAYRVRIDRRDLGSGKSEEAAYHPLAKDEDSRKKKEDADIILRPKEGSEFRLHKDGTATFYANGQKYAEGQYERDGTLYRVRWYSEERQKYYPWSGWRSIDGDMRRK
jgi:hypothetical protein